MTLAPGGHTMDYPDIGMYTVLAVESQYCFVKDPYTRGVFVERGRKERGARAKTLDGGCAQHRADRLHRGPALSLPISRHTHLPPLLHLHKWRSSVCVRVYSPLKLWCCGAS